MFRMHNYPDGLVGLAAFCDTCGKQITEHGYVIWEERPENREVIGWRLIHQGRCEPADKQERRRFAMSMPLDEEIVHLVNSSGADLEAARENLSYLS